MSHLITFINGDGIGNEVIPAARKVLENLDLPLTFQEAQAGYATFEQTGTALPDETFRLCAKSDAILFGATQSPVTRVEGYRSPILTLRRHFELFANIRPARSHNIDILVVRENTEGLYANRERVEDDGYTAIAERVITRAACDRIVRMGCEVAMDRSRKLTLVHKANVLKETDGLFRQVALEIIPEYPQLTIDEKLIDAMVMLMAMKPQSFDVIVTTNLFGDILSELAAGLTGGPGIAPSASIGSSKPALFEPVHGSAPDIAGQGIADPRAAILSAAMALQHLGYRAEASRIQRITYGTPHMGHTDQTTAAIIAAINH